MKSLLSSGCLALSFYVTAAGIALGQAPEPAPGPVPHRPQRILAIGNAVFLGQLKPLTMVGGLWQISVAPTRIQRDDLGVPLVIPPRWYLHTLVTGGASFDPPGVDANAKAAAHAQLGLVRRNDSPITASGPVFHYSSSPQSFGTAVRLEVMDNLGVELGWARLKHSRSDRLMVSVDYFRKICEDLGLGIRC